MILLPISHEDLRTRRWPAVTTAIVVVTIAASTLFLFRERAAERAVADAQRLATFYYRDHPYLRLRPAQPGDLTEDDLPPELTQFLPTGRDAEQKHLDDLVRSAQRQREHLPLLTWAWIPAKKNLVGLFTHALLHGGVLHLGFNLWFLVLTGVNLEDRWGRRVFPLFYVAAAIVAALAHAYFTTRADIPMIGASGAIAGAMGAFLVLFARTKIRFYYWPNLRTRTFLAPAWLMLPLWFGGELFDGLMTPNDGVARFAHVGGFAFGALFAMGMRWSGLDHRLDTNIEKTLVSERDPRLAEADAMIQTRQFADAFALLDAFLAERPMDIDARLLALRASESAGDTARRAAAFAGLVATYGRAGQIEPMVALHAEAIAGGLGDAIAAADHARVARIHEDQGHLDLAEDAYRRAHAGAATDVATVRAMFAHARLAARRGDRTSAIHLYSTLAHADGPALELRADVTRELQTLTQDGASKAQGEMTMPELIELPDPTYDVLVTATPETTPSGEGFVSALAAAFGVQEDVAARLAAGAPMKVKRGVSLSEAERMCRTLASLGASVELVPNDVALPEAAPRPLPPPSPPVTSLPPVTTSVPSPPSVAAISLQAPAPIGIVVRPSMSPPRTSGAPMPQPAAPSPALQLPLFTIPTNVIRGAAVVGVLAVLLLSVRWLKQQTSAHQLGNAGKGESRCINKDCLAMLGLDRKTDTPAQFTLVVAWRHGCLDETGYGTYLDGLHEKHGKSGLQVVGAGLGVPATNDPRSLSQGFQPAPADFPPAGCERGFRVVPTRSGFVEDFFSPPATYLYDDAGYMMAVWKGGMSPAQRDALAAYLDQKL